MVKIMKSGKVVLVLNGRFAGRKAVVVKAYESAQERTYSHALVAGIDKYPLKVTRRMGKKKVANRSKIRPFVKVVSYSHLLPTRYTVDAAIDNSLVNVDALKNPTKKGKAVQAVKKEFESRYKTGKNKCGWPSRSAAAVSFCLSTLTDFIRSERCPFSFYSLCSSPEVQPSDALMLYGRPDLLASSPQVPATVAVVETLSRPRFGVQLLEGLLRLPKLVETWYPRYRDDRSLCYEAKNGWVVCGRRANFARCSSVFLLRPIAFISGFLKTDSSGFPEAYSVYSDRFFIAQLPHSPMIQGV
uniref:Large ribosomal subunit protein eL27 n=1 Tax=Steinernema glaseri TaxID=37863 RepID=A0A1I8AFM5_9BILA